MRSEKFKSEWGNGVLTHTGLRVGRTMLIGWRNEIQVALTRSAARTGVRPYGRDHG